MIMDTKPPFARPVKEYSVEYYVFEDGKQVLDAKFTYKYNKNNQLFEVYQYDSKIELFEVSYYNYNDYQKLKDITIKVADGEQKKQLVYEYADDKLSQITEIAGDYNTVTKYDDYGSPSEKLAYTKDNVQISSTVFVNLYDDKGRLVEKHTILPSGESDRLDKYQYNESGLLIEEQNERKHFTTVAKHSYNDRGDLVLSDFNPGQPNHEMLKREIVYSKDGDVLEIKEYRQGWCYQDHNDTFGLTNILLYTYVR
jgi:hypothetical protein